MAMTKSARWMKWACFDRLRAMRQGALQVGAFASIAWLAGCAVQWQNTQPARELAEQARPPGSVYTGWRVFQDKCATCHGADATGTAGAPNLLPKVSAIGPRQFVDVLLLRYEWTVPPAQAPKSSPERAALIDDIVTRKQGALTMPAWQGEPRVNAHVVDLYAYLSARAAGTQGPGRPAP
jgi:mono/diheme cytochrome c family protein